MPIYATLPAGQVRYIVADAGAKLLVVSGKERARAALEAAAGLDTQGDRHGPRARRRASRRSAICRCPPRSSAPSRRPSRGDDLASLIYTSGTTGDPKGVMLTHRNFMSQVNTIKPLFPITERDISMSFLPLSHVYERTVDYVFLSYGVQINYVESIERVPMQLTEIRPTIMVSVPRLYERSYIKIISKIQAEGGAKKRLFEWGLRVGRQVREAVWRGEKASPFARGQYAVAKARIFSKVMEQLGGRLRFTISGGAPLAREVAEFFDIVGLPILQGYGLTETSPVIAACRLEFNRLGSVGTLIPGVEVRIAPDGEILVRGPNIMKGYWRKPEATAEAIDGDGWLHTGDVGYLDSDGCLFITDRKKDIIVTSGGKNIAPQPIEGRLGATPFIAQAVVIGDKYPYLTALVVPNFENLEAHFAEKGIKGLDRAGMAEHAETNAAGRGGREEGQRRARHARAHPPLHRPQARVLPRGGRDDADDEGPPPHRRRALPRPHRGDVPQDPARRRVRAGGVSRQGTGDRGRDVTSDDRPPVLGARLESEVGVLTRYLRAALHRATYKVLEDGTFLGEIPGFDGVWANAGALEACREELEEVLEEWILFRVSRQLPLPAIDNLELRIREVA